MGGLRFGVYGDLGLQNETHKVLNHRMVLNWFLLCHCRAIINANTCEQPGGRSEVFLECLYLYQSRSKGLQVKRELQGGGDLSLKSWDSANQIQTYGGYSGA